jgi:hypothetical protein
MTAEAVYTAEQIEAARRYAISDNDPLGYSFTCPDCNRSICNSSPEAAFEESNRFPDCPNHRMVLDGVCAACVKDALYCIDKELAEDDTQSDTSGMVRA